jgi:hypothetical protein
MPPFHQDKGTEMQGFLFVEFGKSLAATGTQGERIIAYATSWFQPRNGKNLAASSLVGCD